MRIGIALVVFSLLFRVAYAQNLNIGDWRVHMPYNSSISIAQANDLIYSASNTSLFSYDLIDGGVQKIDKTDGLTDFGIKFIKYDDALDVLLIAYSNGNIDLILNGNELFNISDIKDRVTVGDKSINSAYFDGNFAYLSANLGIIVLDVENLEIRDTYIIGDNGDELQVNGVTIYNNSLYAATADGIKYAPLSSSNLSDFSNWSLVESSQGVPASGSQSIFSWNDGLYAYFGYELYNSDGGSWQKVYGDSTWIPQGFTITEQELIVAEWQFFGGQFNDHRLTFLNTSNQAVYESYDKVSRPVQAIKRSNGTLYVADFFNGLIEINNETVSNIIPNGPYRNQAFDIQSEDDKVMVAAGGVTAGYDFTFNENGFYTYTDGWWTNYNQFNQPALDGYFDIITIAPDPNSDKIYYGSYLAGLIEFDNGNIITYDQNNSILEGALGDESRTKISSLAYDDQGNLWMSNYGSENPAKVLMNDGTWFAFNPKLGVNQLKKLIVDQFNQKWFTVRSSGGGILVFDEGDDMTTTADDVTRQLSRGVGAGNLPNTNVLSIVEDNEGEIWVGTDEGIAVFYCGGSVLLDEGCDAQRIIVERDGFNGFLFETEIVKALAVDGANRKWVGTTNGAWLISPDGTEELFHFTTENSPLPSNDITSIGINNESGEVFIGTELGLVSYMSDATAGAATHEDVLVFPNPVNPDYLGPIAIRGLVDGAFVKITDVSGGLIFEGPANGGQAIWDGNNYTGERAKSGVYMVFSSNDDGSEKFVAKILIVN